MNKKFRQFERSIYSQNGEDGIIEEIFHRIGTTNKFFVEFGVEDGTECNTRLLRESGWDGVCFDSVIRNKYIHRTTLTCENINDTFANFNVPIDFDLLSIDVDGNDFWLWKSLENYFPRCVVIEYNCQIPPDELLVIPYVPNFKWNGNSFYGASLGALIKLGETKGYTYLCVNELVKTKYVNAFFIKSEYLDSFSDIDMSKGVVSEYEFSEHKYDMYINPFC